MEMLLETIRSNITRHCLIVILLMFIRFISHCKFSHYIFDLIVCMYKLREFGIRNIKL